MSSSRRLQCLFAIMTLIGATLACQFGRAAPTAEPEAERATRTPRPGATTEAEPEATQAAADDSDYEILEHGRDETFDGEPLAYLWTVLVTPDVADPAFEDQMRWGFGRVAAEYPDVPVLQLLLDWQETFLLMLEVRADDWASCAAGDLTWARLWDRAEVAVTDYDSDEWLEGDEAEAYLAAAAGDETAEIDVTPVLDAETAAEQLDETIGDAAGLFEMSYPGEWVAGPYETGVRVWADDSGAVGLDVLVEVKAVSAEQLAESYSEFFAYQYQGYQEGAWEADEVDGYLAVYVPQTYRYADVMQRGFIATVVRNRIGWLLVGYAPEDQYDQYGPLLEAMARSLDLTEFDDAPPYAEWETYAGEAANFHYLPGTYVAEEIEAIAEAHESALAYNAGWLGVEYTGPAVEFFLYPSAEALYHATARESGFSLNEITYGAAEVHAIWVSEDDHQSVGHELTHVITAWTLGEAGQALLGEGVAVCLDHGDEPIHARASNLGDNLLPLADLLGDAWFDRDPVVAYTQSGSVACWLLERYGADAFQELFPRTDFEAALEEIYGFDLEYLETDWRTMLEHS